MKEWELYQEHDEDIYNLLKATKCIGSKKNIRAWHKDTWDKINELGHDSLDFFKCKCRKEAEDAQ